MIQSQCSSVPFSDFPSSYSLGTGRLIVRARGATLNVGGGGGGG